MFFMFFFLISLTTYPQIPSQKQDLKDVLIQTLVLEASLLLQKESVFVSPATLKGNIYEAESKK